MSRIFVQIDLKQAESRFVAYDSADADLIRMLEDPVCDIHRYVAAEIFQKPESEITYEQRQLGKKSGHGANYSMGASTFQDSCLREMNLVLSRKEASNVLEAYHRLFPGIRAWHRSIQETVRRERKLATPLGRERYFYGRMDDSTFREAYAYRPQSSIPDIINRLMLGLWDARSAGQFPSLWMHLQCHDSLTLSCTTNDVQEVATYARDLDRWHPEVVLPAGRLRIPVSIESGSCLGDLEDYPA